MNRHYFGSFFLSCLAVGLMVGYWLWWLLEPIYADLNDESQEALDEAGTAARITALERRVFKAEMKALNLPTAPKAAPAKVHHFPKKKNGGKS